MAMLTHEAVAALGFASVGRNVQISERASFYGAERIALGNNIRIDDFCVLSAGEGGICIGNYVHIAVYSCVMGAGKITFSDFSGLSSRVSIYSSNDDYSGATMSNPTVPSQFAGATHADVHIGKHVIIGCGSVILPGVTLEEGVAVGALSLVNRNCRAFGIYSGNPARRISERKRGLLEMERQISASTAPEA
jgi:dTDP-4-amino-4,6-dideoxy-D-glucose acyltransferase